MNKPKREPLQSLKGMDDVLPAQVGMWQHVEKVLRDVFERWGLQEIRTPVLEKIDLFKRSIGEETDIVSKEMFAFEDRGGREIALRPEMTASVVRSYIQHQLSVGRPHLGFYYFGSMFRSERPQKGRKREFYQAGCEIFSQGGIFDDFDLVSMLNEALKELGLEKYEFRINHLGTFEEREAYLIQLKKFLKAHESKLSADSKRRLQTNVLRVFDSKSEEDQPIIAKAPKIVDALGKASQKELNFMEERLKSLGIPFKLEPRIVRGIDYYTGFVYEVTHPACGAQDAIGAGGRYDGLVEALGGPPTGASGFALGIERMLMALEAENKYTAPQALTVYLGALSSEDAYRSRIHELRVKELSQKKIKSIAGYAETRLKKHLATASKLGVHYSVILGEEEMAANQVLVKDMKTGDQEKISFNQLGATLKSLERKKGN